MEEIDTLMGSSTRQEVNTRKGTCYFTTLLLQTKKGFPLFFHFFLPHSSIGHKITVSLHKHALKKRNKKKWPMVQFDQHQEEIRWGDEVVLWNYSFTLMLWLFSSYLYIPWVTLLSQFDNNYKRTLHTLLDWIIFFIYHCKIKEYLYNFVYSFRCRTVS